MLFLRGQIFFLLLVTSPECEEHKLTCKHSPFFSFFFLGACKSAAFTNSHRQEYERRPVRSDPHWLKLSTVSRPGAVGLTVSLAAPATTGNRCLALPFSPLTAPAVDETRQLSVLTCSRWWFSKVGAVLLCAARSEPIYFKCPQIPFTSRPCPSSCLAAPLSRSRSVCFSPAGGLWVGALFHQPGASVRVLFHFASWC